MQEKSKRNKIVIEKGVPLPKNAKTIDGKYPFSTMEIDDSFFVPHITRESLRATAHYWCKLNKKKWGFITEKETDEVTGEVIGVRIWAQEINK